MGCWYCDFDMAPLAGHVLLVATVAGCDLRIDTGLMVGGCQPVTLDVQDLVQELLSGKVR